MATRTFIMDERVTQLRKTKGSKDTCHTCGIKIKIGNTVVTRIGISRGCRPIRHESCARRVGVIA